MPTTPWYMHACMCMCVYGCARMYMCVHVRMYVCACVCMGVYVCICVCMCVCTYACLCHQVARLLMQDRVGVQQAVVEALHQAQSQLALTQVGLGLALCTVCAGDDSSSSSRGKG